MKHSSTALGSRARQRPRIGPKPWCAGITNVVCLLVEVCYGRADATRAVDLGCAETWDEWALALDATLEHEAGAVLV